MVGLQLRSLIRVTLDHTEGKGLPYEAFDEDYWEVTLPSGEACHNEISFV